VSVGIFSYKFSRARAVVAHDYDVRFHRDDVVDGVDERFAFFGAGV